MRILHLTAGTGTWHCGSCIRDDLLVKGLRDLSYQADLIPMYLPIVADGTSCSAGETVWIGGVNAYLQQEMSMFRHVPRWMDAVLSTRPVLSLAGRFSGSTRPESLGAMTVSMLRGVDGNQAKEVARLIDGLKARPKADVIVLSNSMLLGLRAPLQEALGVPVVCAVQGEPHFMDALETGREEAWALVRAELAACDARIAVSGFAADLMADRTGLARDGFDVVHNGIDLSGYGPPEPPEVPTLGYLARMYDAKGLANLVHAYVVLRERGHDALRLAIGGTMNPGDRPDVMRARAVLEEAGVAESVRWHPNLSWRDKQAFLRGLTVFTVPTAKDDTFGQYNLEAMASGVPVVAPNRGAMPEVVGGAGGGVLVTPDDPHALADAIDALLTDDAARTALGKAGRAGVEAGFTSVHMAARVGAILERVVAAT